MFDISLNIPQLKFQIDLETKSETCMRNNIKLVKFLPSIESLYMYIYYIYMKPNFLRKHTPKNENHQMLT
jgi:hypothetical protein